MNNRIFYTKPSITSLETDYAADAAVNGWGAACYDYIQRFERLFADHLGVKHAIATSSCTGALHMGLAALGISRGDEVIVADTNWIASIAPIVHLGATPVFVDICPHSWCADPSKVEAAITHRTKAILAVHLYGNLCDMTALQQIASRHEIPVIEDAAEAIGSIFEGKRAGSIGKFGTFSFHGSKTVSTGEGGAFVTNDSSLYESVLTLSNHGRTRNSVQQFRPEMVGFKYKMANIQAAIGCAQIERIDSLIERKREIFHFYHKHLSRHKVLTMNVEYAGTRNGYWMPTVVFDRNTQVTREMLLEAFSAENIDARVFFSPLSSFSMFVENLDNHIARDIPTRAINLPSYHDITEVDQARVVSVVKSLIP